jgi:hypothetical protein
MRFYFDVREGAEITVDEEGVELPQVDSALMMARMAAAEMARDVFATGKIDQLTVEVRTAERVIARAILYLRLEFPDA